MVTGLETVQFNKNTKAGFFGSFAMQKLSSDEGLLTAPNATDVTARRNLSGMVLNKNDWHSSSSPNLFKSYSRGENVNAQSNPNNATLNVLFGKTKTSLFDIKFEKSGVSNDKYGKISNPFTSNSGASRVGTKFDSNSYFKELNDIQKFFT